MIDVATMKALIHHEAYRYDGASLGTRRVLAAWIHAEARGARRAGYDTLASYMMGVADSLTRHSNARRTKETVWH